MSVSTANPMKDAALEYAARGWRVLPLGRHGKIPRLKDWVNNASSDPEMILKWWDESYYEEDTKFHGSTEYNVGIACGRGLVVVDVDGEEGEETLQFLLMQHDADINTLECHTGTGRHLYFQCDAELRNTASTFLGNKLDTRGAGGQVVAPPSIHPNGKAYEWANDLDPAPMPQWMLDLLLKPKGGERLVLEAPAPSHRQPENGGVIHAYDKPRFLEQLNFLARMPEGSGRNHKFNLLVFDAARMFRSGFCDSGYVEHELKMAARSSGLDDREIEATWNSAWNAGLASPTPWTHPERTTFNPQPQQLPQRKKGKLVVTRLSEAEIQPVAFMWGYRIVRDAINVLAGDGGIGKSTLALHIARSITNLEEEAALPDDDGQRIHGEVLLVAYEDHLGRILQQAEILDINTENLHVIEGRREEDGVVVPFGMADVPDLIELLDERPAVRMLILDPWTEFMNDNPNQEEPIRAALKPLNALAKDKNITVLILAHTNKRSEFNNAVDRIAGHGALKNRSRSTLMAGRTEAGQIAIAHAKANASQPASTFLYEWDDDKRWDKGENPFVWIGKSSLTPNEVFAQRSPTKVEAAQRWLRVMLAEGPMPAADIMQLADEEGFKTGTLNAAKEKVAISRKDGIGAWVWELKR